MSDQENVTPENPDLSPEDPADFLASGDDSTPPVEEPTPPVEEPTPPVVDSGEEEARRKAAEDAAAEEARRKAAEEADALRAKSLEELTAEREKIEGEAQALADEIDAKNAKAYEFADWVERHRRTFLWKMLSKMQEQRKAVVATQDSYLATMSNLDLPQPGELVRLRKRFHKTILRVLVISFLIWLVYFLITKYLEYGWVIQLSSLGGTILTYILSFALAIIIGAFILYYRDWRQFDWKVKKLLKRLENVAKGVDKVRQEEVRLFSLYPQVVDWLEIIGYSLNRPWMMNDRWFKSYLSDLNQDEFPFSLRIAQAQESDASSMNKLHGSTMKRFAVRGWRTKVLKDQIHAIAQKVGLPLERMNVEGVDQDIAYSPGGPRVELRKGLENQEALELVARKQLVPLTFKVQSEEITKSRPPVKENRTNRLDAIQADQAGLEEEERVDWDKFLQEPIGPFNGVITPFSLASLAPGEIMRGYHEKVTSHFVVPERLKELAKQNPGARVETYLETANLPMDIVIRMDLSMPMSPHALKINPKDIHPESASSYSTSAVHEETIGGADDDGDDD